MSIKDKKPIIYIVMLCMIVCMLTASCKSIESVPQTSTNAVPPPSTADSSFSKLGIGDDIQVDFLYWPELNTRQRVRVDGKISLGMVGDVQVAGLTPEELDERLTKLYEGEILDPDIAVIVHSSANVYVDGQVLAPGVIPMQGPLTVLEAIISAGGYDPVSAKLSDVIVIQQKGDKRHVESVNLKRMLVNRESSAPYYLSPNSIVYVPRTKIIKIDQWVNTYISGLVATPFTYSSTRTGLSHTSTFGVTGQSGLRGGR